MSFPALSVAVDALAAACAKSGRMPEDFDELATWIPKGQPTERRCGRGPSASSSGRRVDVGMTAQPTERVWPTPSGRWGLLQLQDVVNGVWRATGPSGYENREDAEAEVEYLNTQQPGRWKTWDRQA